MPNRVLRDWTDSESMNIISSNAECLFVRLMMKADDFGNFHANTKLVKSLCFPLKDYRETDISRWMDELQKSGLIAFYEAGNKKYLSIPNFGQRLRNMRNIFPKPLDSESRRVAASCGELPPETNRNETESESESEDETEVKANPEVVFKELSDQIKDMEPVSQWIPIRDFIKEHHPNFFEPYLAMWNVFAIVNGIKKGEQLPTTKRKDKFKTRIKEPQFNFLSILSKIKESDFLMGRVKPKVEEEKPWTVDIDFILDSENNYIKILEGKYDNNK